MIDNPTQVATLMDHMRAQLPIPALPTIELVHALRERGPKLKADRITYIQRVLYLGDEGGIVCDVTPSLESKEKAVVSITHLRIPPAHPLSGEIRAYQKERMRRLSARDI